jgi:hypothetical protein
MPGVGISTRLRDSAVLDVGIILALIGVFAPVRESRIHRAATRLDAVMPAWQFRELHRLRVAAPPDSVFAAIKAVRADEIFLFRTLTWIRRGGRALPESILHAGNRDPLIEVALRGGFVPLAEDPPRELVIGTVVAGQPGATATLTEGLIRKPPPGHAVAAMNFLVTPDGPNASVVSTETRVFANGSGTRRRFAAYWRVIYPGSALIRRMWLRAVRERAEGKGNL